MRSIVVVIAGVALALVIGVDVWQARSAGRAASEIYDNVTRAIELVEDMRWQLHRLAFLHGSEVDPTIKRIEADAAAYAPLATFAGEAEAWATVRTAITSALELARKGDFVSLQQRSDATNAAMGRLVDINSQEAHALASRIMGEHHFEIIGDTIAVAIAGLVLAVLFGRVSRLQARERQLIAKSLEDAEARNRELDAFAGRAAHDLRSPLNPIRGYAELIATDERVPAEARRQASLVTKAVLRMTRVIDDMLALARAGHPEPGTASIAQVVSHVREELAADLTDAMVHVDVPDIQVACNDVSLEQLIRNLVGNAAKYRSSERRLEVWVGAQAMGDRVEIAVADNGIGLEPESMQHAFDPFYRGRKDIAGTGLGLSIVERVTRAYGGACRIDAKYTPGTRIVIQLPVAQ